MTSTLKPHWNYFIFDLDDTLIDTTNLLIPIQKTPAFFQRIQQPLPLFPGAKDLLDALKSHAKLFLITQGNPEVQRQKIQSASVERYFDQILIANTESQETKDMKFAQLFEKLDSKQTLVIGNRKKTDLRPAKALGAKTCWYKYGEYLHEPESTSEESPDYTVNSYFELSRLCLP